MAIDSPARIAVLGAGPIGLEAALYARFLGYEVEVYERGRAAENVLRWGHVRMLSPFGMNRSALGLAALAAQDSQWRPPADEALLTGREWAELYLLPLANSDLLVDSIRQRTEVLAVGRDCLLLGELAGQVSRGDPDLRLLLGDADGERFATADAVIDATGVFGNPNWLGPGGLPAVGERENRERIEYGTPDIAGRERDRYAGQRVLVVGNDHAAAGTLLALAKLAESAPETRVTWISRVPATADDAAEGTAASSAPIMLIDNDPLPARRELATAANELAKGNPHITHWPGAEVERIRWKEDSQRFSLRLLRAPEEKLKVDRIVAHVGYRPCASLYAELPVAETSPGSGLGKSALILPEPDFYVLGAKSHGRSPLFLCRDGLQQIRELFAILGDRPELDLYASIGQARR